MPPRTRCFLVDGEPGALSRGGGAGQDLFVGAHDVAVASVGILAVAELHTARGLLRQRLLLRHVAVDSRALLGDLPLHGVARCVDNVVFEITRRLQGVHAAHD